MSSDQGRGDRAGRGRSAGLTPRLGPQSSEEDGGLGQRRPPGSQHPRPADRRGLLQGLTRERRLRVSPTPPPPILPPLFQALTTAASHCICSAPLPSFRRAPTAAPPGARRSGAAEAPRHRPSPSRGSPRGRRPPPAPPPPPGTRRRPGLQGSTSYFNGRAALPGSPAGRGGPGAAQGIAEHRPRGTAATCCPPSSRQPSSASAALSPSPCGERGAAHTGARLGPRGGAAGTHLCLRAAAESPSSRRLPLPESLCFFRFFCRASSRWFPPARRGPQLGTGAGPRKRPRSPRPPPAPRK